MQSILNYLKKISLNFKMHINATRLYFKFLNKYKHSGIGKENVRNKIEWIEPVGTHTDIKIYNPIVKTEVPLILQNKGFLTWYMCGPTVYDSAHIGHATTYVTTDIIQRILSDYFNIQTMVVMGITDIDDKIIKRSAQEGRNFKELSQFYENEFFDDMQKLNIRMPCLSCKVSEYVPEIIQFIDNILIKGNAYVTNDGNVYFDTKSFSRYGKLMPPFVEKVAETNKRSSMDFALWKAAKKDEPFWNSPWGNGRPGWHIECSTIASAIFGKSIDIHSGGIDLIFPHHENEEAQSCCYHSVEQWVNYWLHCGHLSLKGDVKMSKSLKNTISIQKFLTKYSANQFRMLCLLSHYRNGIEYSEEVMRNAVEIMKKLDNFIGSCNNYVTGKLNNRNIDEVTLLRCLHETKQTVHAALANDFNTAQAIHAIIRLVDVGNKMLSQSSDTSNNKSAITLAVVSNYISEFLSKLGVTTVVHTTDTHRINEILQCFIEFRNTVRNDALSSSTKNQVLLTACDVARAKLALCRVTVKDQKNSSTWSIQKY